MTKKDLQDKLIAEYKSKATLVYNTDAISEREKLEMVWVFIIQETIQATYDSIVESLDLESNFKGIPEGTKGSLWEVEGRVGRARADGIHEAKQEIMNQLKQWKGEE